MPRSYVASSGFSIVELIITISIIGILVGIVVFTPKTFLVTARDQERSDDIKSISRRLEEAYASQDLGYAAYPSTTELANDVASRIRTMSRISPDAFQSPGGVANSIVSATSNATTNPAGTNTPSLAQYVYQPLTSAGALCTANPSTSSKCVRFNLYYRNEEANGVKVMKSSRQQ